MRSGKRKRSYFSSRLKRLREEKGCTQRELARIMGVHRATIDYYETRANNPRLSTLQKLAAFFEVPVTYFIEQNEDT